MRKPFYWWDWVMRIPEIIKRLERLEMSQPMDQDEEIVKYGETEVYLSEGIYSIKDLKEIIRIQEIRDKKLVGNLKEQLRSTTP